MSDERLRVKSQRAGLRSKVKGQTEALESRRLCLCLHSTITLKLKVAKNRTRPRRKHTRNGVYTGANTHTRTHSRCLLSVC